MAARRVPPTPTSGPRAISDKETSIRAIREGVAAARNYTRNGDLCPAKLCFNTDVEAEDIAAADTITDQANQDGRAFFDTLFPDDVYTVEWKAKPRNMLVMEALGTYVMGDFPKNNGETDAQYYMRAAGAGARHRIFQQRFPLPPAFDCDHLDPANVHLGEPILMAILVSLWDYHKRSGKSKLTQRPGHPYQGTFQAESHWVKVDQCVIGVLCSIHYRGFGKKQLFSNAYKTIDSQANRQCSGPHIKACCDAFITYLVEHFNYPATERLMRLNVPTLQTTNFYAQLHSTSRGGMMEKLRHGCYSDQWILSICQGTGQIETADANKISGGLFYKNYLLLDMLLPEFRYVSNLSQRNGGVAIERCGATTRHLTNREREWGFADGTAAQPFPWTRIYESPFPGMVFKKDSAADHDQQLADYESEPEFV